MNPSDRYFQQRQSRFPGKDVDPQLLRDHLDFVRGAQKFSPGLNPTVITVTKDATAESLSLFPDMSRPDIVLRVEGQRFGANVI